MRTFTQDNGFTAQFQLSHAGDGNKISGSGVYNRTGLPLVEWEGQPQPPVRGTVEGSINGSTFQFTARWKNGAAGEYTGVIDDRGGITGTTYEKDDPDVTAGWQSDGKAVCIPEPPPIAAARCPSGFVWRERFDGDTECVKPDERYRLADGSCRSGYVWRDSFSGDNVCVTPAERAAVKAQKRRDELGVVTDRPGAAGLVDPIQDHGVTKKPPAGFDPNR